MEGEGMSKKAAIVAKIDEEINARNLGYGSEQAYEVFSRRGIEAILTRLDEIESKLDLLLSK
jgi:hypothetical protein